MRFYKQDTHVLNRSFMNNINENLCKHEKIWYLSKECVSKNHVNIKEKILNLVLI